MGQTIGWARVWFAVKHDDDVTLRQGAWYPVVNTAATRVELDVSGRRVTVPQDVIELRRRRPDRFTVVYRTWNDPNPAQGTKADVGRTYAVCPKCASRVRLPKLPRLGTSGVLDTSTTARAVPQVRPRGRRGLVGDGVAQPGGASRSPSRRFAKSRSAKSTRSSSSASRWRISSTSARSSGSAA